MLVSEPATPLSPVCCLWKSDFQKGQHVSVTAAGAVEKRGGAGKESCDVLEGDLLWDGGHLEGRSYTVDRKA